MNNYQSCPNEHKVSNHISTCLSKEPCEYKRVFPHNFHFCYKHKSYQDATELFIKEKKGIEEKLNGHNY